MSDRDPQPEPVSDSPWPVAAALCVAQALGGLGVMFFPALLPLFQAEWNLSNVAAGWINGVFYAGYAVAVPLLVSLTDRIDARRLFLASCVLGVLAMLGFALAADGVASASLFRLIGGIAFAAAYMPGAKALADRIGGAARVRGVAVYTAFSAIGSALSVALAGALQAWLGWRWAAGALALGPLAAGLLVLVLVPPRAPLPRPGRLWQVFDIRPVLRNRPALGYILAYTGHSFELFGFRAWLVAFLAAAIAAGPATAAPLGAQAAATLVLLAGVPASILGNEGAMRWGRRPMIALYVGLTALVGCGLGFTLGLPVPLVMLLALAYGTANMLDSGSLTAGMVDAAVEENRGVTMALHSFMGFGAGLLAPLAVGGVLDLAGGGRLGWGLGFALLALIAASGPLWLTLLHRLHQQEGEAWPSR